MPLIWQYLQREHGRTTDFSYGGLLMWVDLYKYEFDILFDTLFIKSTYPYSESPVFSLPVGSLDLSKAVQIIKAYCVRHRIKPKFSGIPEYALEHFINLSTESIKPDEDIFDYLYDAQALAYLHGKKYNKKRNHVNRFIADHPDWRLVPITAANADIAMKFMDRYDLEGDLNESASAERALTRKMISHISAGDNHLIGALLVADGQTCALTIGDIKADTLFIHIEKALREYSGSYEMINMAFAKNIVETNPNIRFINREDDTGDLGLRMAKQSYHPVNMLAKYDISF
ncbi:MAG: phosphatidylglycerol lysyltransferase domain-containing protein [Muribaculum sp.]|nr:phosphatidylglycerol lysyltransferase domain-containing protein [Muribaculum sp.]